MVRTLCMRHSDIGPCDILDIWLILLTLHVSEKDHWTVQAGFRMLLRSRIYNLCHCYSKTFSRWANKK